MSLRSITEPNQPPALYVGTQPASPMQLNVSSLFSIGTLDTALVESEEKLRENDQKISNLRIEFAFNLGRKYEILKGEEETLKNEITLQHRRIEALEAVHQEKWTACLEAAEVRVQAISHEISKFIQSLETFKMQYPEPLVNESGKVDMHQFIKLGGEDGYCKVFGTLTCQDEYITAFKHWLIVTDKPVNESVRKFPQYRSAVETVIPVKGLQTPIPIGDSSKIASFLQDMQALEKEVTGLKQELHSLERSHELKEKVHRNSITRLKWAYLQSSFERHFDIAKALQEDIDTNVKWAAQRLHDIETKKVNEWSGCEKIRAAVTEEWVRIKDMIDTIIPLIQEAIEWTKEGETI